MGELKVSDFISPDSGVLTIPPQTWNWAFGQTPEFTYKIEKGFAWGRIVCDLHIFSWTWIDGYPGGRTAVKTWCHLIVHIHKLWNVGSNIEGGIGQASDQS